MNQKRQLLLSLATATIKKSGVFAKIMIKSFRSKSKQRIGGLAFINLTRTLLLVVTSTVDDLKIKDFEIKQQKGNCNVRR